MDQTVHEIETHIIRTRDHLGANLKELEQRADAAIDWRQRVRSRPLAALGVACVAGAVLAAVLRSKNRVPSDVARDAAATRYSRSGAEAREQAHELVQNIQSALIGLGAARVTEYIGRFVPRFDEYLRRAEQRRNATHGTTAEFGRV